MTYATGKSEVPNFDGLSRAAAIREARDAGFGEPEFTERESSKPAGTVIAQSPQAGATVDRDTTIRLTLATAPTPPPPPPTTAATDQNRQRQQAAYANAVTRHRHQGESRHS